MEVLEALGREGPFLAEEWGVAIYTEREQGQPVAVLDLDEERVHVCIERCLVCDPHTPDMNLCQAGPAPAHAL